MYEAQTPRELLRYNKAELMVKLVIASQQYQEDGDESNLDAIENIVYVLRHGDYNGREA